MESWPVQQFQAALANKTLTISPEYQRRPVWTAKEKMLLVDSVARAVPVGAITLYEESPAGFSVWEVIDGKQRLTALLEFLEDQLIVRTNVVASVAVEEDEFDLEADPITASYHGKRFAELDAPASIKLLQYKMPVFVVEGSRANAIRAFTRMNRTNYALKPQEIRNAFFAGSTFLETSIELVSELDAALTAGPAVHSSLMVSLGVISRQNFDRMQDIQLASELLVLVLQGPQHRRDSLDSFYDLYRDPGPPARSELARAKDRVAQIIGQIRNVADDTALQAMHFPSACENDFYGLVGAFKERGLLTAPQFAALASELREVMSGFRQQVELYVDRVREGQAPGPDEFGQLVEDYGRGFLGGQINSKTRREDRIRVWVEVINSLVLTLDPHHDFTDLQRRIIWARSADKVCARCGLAVEWAEFHAGHKVAHALGGRTVVENGQVEHGTCNQAAGAANVSE